LQTVLQWFGLDVFAKQDHLHVVIPGLLFAAVLGFVMAKLADNIGELGHPDRTMLQLGILLCAGAIIASLVELTWRLITSTSGRIDMVGLIAFGIVLHSLL